MLSCCASAINHFIDGLTHWGYVFLALTHRYKIYGQYPRRIYTSLGWQKLELNETPKQFIPPIRAVLVDME